MIFWKQGGDVTLVVSAAYYAMFLAATAALNEADPAAKLQEGTIPLFSKHYVKEGPLDDHYGTLLANAQDKRTDADYARSPSIIQEDAEKWLHHAGDHIDAVGAMLLDAASGDDPAPWDGVIRRESSCFTGTTVCPFGGLCRCSIVDPSVSCTYGRRPRRRVGCPP